MESIVGIFRTNGGIDDAIARLKQSGFGHDKVTLLCPGESNDDVESRVSTSDTEGEGMGQAMGGTVGGAIGVAGGAALGAAITSLFIPGVGPIVVIGALGALAFGAGGAILGSAAGKSLEEGLAQGLPHDELFIYEDALRQGFRVLVVSADDQDLAAKAHEVLERAGAESVDVARENWWLGLRAAEKETYEAEGRDFARDEASYRRGFEAALNPNRRGKSLDGAMADLNVLGEGTTSDQAFRLGFDRGLAYQRALQEKRVHADSTAAAPGIR